MTGCKASVDGAVSLFSGGRELALSSEQERVDEGRGSREVGDVHAQQDGECEQDECGVVDERVGDVLDRLHPGQDAERWLSGRVSSRSG